MPQPFVSTRRQRIQWGLGPLLGIAGCVLLASPYGNGFRFIHRDRASAETRGAAVRSESNRRAALLGIRSTRG